MMKIRHKKTGKEETISRDKWEKEPGQYGPSRNDWDIIDQGDPVILIEYLSVGKYKEIRISDRDHAIEIINSDPKKYSFIELSEGLLKPVVPFKQDETSTYLNYKRFRSVIDKALRQDNIQEVIESGEYFFNKLLKKYREFLSFEIPISQGAMDGGYDYEQKRSYYAAIIQELKLFYSNKGDNANYGDFLNGINNENEKQLLILIGQLIAYLDYHAYNKSEWNEYEDKRVVARNSIRQNLWVEHLLRLKNPGSEQIYPPGIDNAITFLNRPHLRLTILSERHRNLISKNLLGTPYKKERFTIDVDNFFSFHRISIKSVENLFILYSKLLYSRPLREIWDVEADSSIDNENEEIEGENEDTGVIASGYDKSAYLRSDGPSHVDELGREDLVKSVTGSINELFSKYNDAYTVLLNGEWGSGKSSMLNFFEKYLTETDWKVIRYNAWENQQFKDPWWILINMISKKATDENYNGDFSSHRRWKLGIQYDNKLWALLLIALFVGSIVYLFNANNKLEVSTITGILALITSIVTAIVGITNNFFYKNISNEDLKERFTGHPFEPIRERFNVIARENKLAIFIDDLDRCDVNATVSLLEGIQNLFKGVPVLYIIAADGRWVSNCFTLRYQSFNNLTNDGCSIGDKFLQKTFQLTLNVPKPDPEDLQLYWDNLIGQAKLPELVATEETTLTPVKPTEAQRAEVYQENLKNRSHEREEKLKEVKLQIEENIEHYLRKFIKLGVSDNPRQMKRFVNQYEVSRQMMVIEGTSQEFEEDDKLVLFLIFEMRYPTLADQLKKGERSKDEILTTEKNLTAKDKEDIKKLLQDIDDELIRGAFYSI